MGNSQGTEGAGKCGYRVLGVQPNSPASKVGLVSFFDFIVAADGEHQVSLGDFSLNSSRLAERRLEIQYEIQSICHWSQSLSGLTRNNRSNEYASPICRPLE